MDGYTLLTQLRQAIGESGTSTWPEAKLSYEMLYRAAVATADRSGIITSSQIISTVANQAAYLLNADFLRLFLMDSQNRLYIKYTHSTFDSFIYWVDYSSIVMNNASVSVDVPNWFSITDAAPLSQITGSTNTDSSSAFDTNTTYSIFGESLGESTLGTGASLSNVSAGDIIHHPLDDSHGIVLALSSSITLAIALFGGTQNYFTSGRAFFINPQQRYQLVLDPPPATTGDTVTLGYVKKPAPVYSAYRSYPFPNDFHGLVQRASWEYRFRDKQPDFGDRQYRNWEVNVKELGKAVNKAKRRKRFHVNFNMPADREFTFRR